MTFEGSRKPISSLASVDGLPLFDWLDGPTTSPSGPDLVRAKGSVLRAPDVGSMTPAISGPSGSVSSASARLQSSLESKLKQRFGTAGSTLFNQTWKEKATPSGLRYWAHTASARRTSDSGSGSWPTPCGQDGPNGGPAQGLDRLPGAASAAWPTTTRDWKSTASNMHGQNARPLNEVARLATWPTPRVATNGGYGNGDLAMSGANCRLEDTAQIAAWSSPRANKWGFPDAHGSQETPLASWPTPLVGSTNPAAHNQISGQYRKAMAEILGPTSNGSPAETAKPGQLNPAFSLWLMGYPAEWVSCGARATQSSRKSRRSS